MLRKLDLMKEAVDVFVEATHSLPLHWGAWLELCNLITNIDMVHIQHHMLSLTTHSHSQDDTVSFNTTHSLGATFSLVTLHIISQNHKLTLNTTQTLHHVLCHQHTSILSTPPPRTLTEQHHTYSVSTPHSTPYIINLVQH